MVDRFQKRSNTLLNFQNLKSPIALIKYYLIFLSTLLLIKYSEQRIGPTTLYDGQNYNYNTYTTLGGQAGMYFDMSQFSTSMTAYTMTIWVRVAIPPLNVSRSLSVVTFSPGFTCYFNTRFRVECDSDLTTQNSLVIDGSVRLNNWYVLVLRSQQSSTLLQLRELSNTIFSYTQSGSFFPTNYQSLAYTFVYVGIDPDFRSEGFIGGLRNLKVFSSYYDDGTMWKTQFSYILPVAESQLQLRLADPNDLTDTIYQAVGSQKGITQQLVKTIDYTANWYCDFTYANNPDPNSETTQQNLLFDGVTCIDYKTKMYLNSDSAYISSTFTPTVDLKSHTIEFWVKPTATVQGDAFYFALATSPYRISTLYTVLFQSQQDSLYCYVQYSTNTTAKVQFLDYTSSLRIWQHMACIIDSVGGLVQGVYNNGVNDNVYYSEIASTAYLPKQDYLVMLNSDPRSNNNGIKNTYYAEMRVWSYARTTQDIKDYQFHQLNVDRFRPNLLNYFKLMNGGLVLNENEIDYADATLTKTVALTSNYVWQNQSSDISICPYGTYKGLNTDPTCYREGVTKFQIFVIKNATYFSVTPWYSIFRNNMIRDDNRNIFNFSWTLTSMQVNNLTNQNLFNSYFNYQKGRKELAFTYDQVSDMPGVYNFNVQMSDMMNQMDIQTASFTMKTYKCLSIFDKATGLSVVMMDMNTKKSVEDSVYYYDFTSCGNYVFQKNLLTMDIDYSNQITLLTSDHNQAQQTFTLRAAVQSYLPLNEYFYIRLKGVWVNKLDSQDQITYYLIYGCRYITKLVAKLIPNYYLVLKGLDLEVNFDAQYYNMPTSVTNRQYTIQWSCPQKIQTYCSTQTNPTFKLPYNTYLNSGLSFWTSIPIQLILTTNFIQGDGTKTSYSSINLVWSDVNPDAQALFKSPVLSKEYRIAFQVNILNLDEPQVTIAWTTNPTIPTNCQLNGNNRKQFVIDQTCVTEGTNYNVTSSIYYLAQNQTIWTSSNFFTLPTSPKNGKISCNSTNGRAYLDYFSCTSSGWSTSATSIRYQFYITDISTGNLVPISGLISSATFIGTMPPTKTLTVKVVDSNNGIAYATLGMSVTYSYDANSVSSRISQLVSTAVSSQTQTNLQSIVAASQASALLDSIGNQSLDIQYSVLDFQTSLTNSILSQSQQLSALISDEMQRRSFIQASVSSFSSMTKNQRFFNAANSNNMMNSLYTLINGSYSDSFNNLLYDQNFNKQLFNVFENVYIGLQQLLNQGNITNAMMDQEPAKNNTLSNLTKTARTVLGVYERFVSVSVYEGQSFLYNNSVFSFYVTKFSRMANNQGDQQIFYPNGQYTSYMFPLSDATQPTSRQSFSALNFKVSPFNGDWYLNQTATSASSVYFSYRDENGNYLDNTYLRRRLSLTFKYEYSPFVFLPNVTTCGYIGLLDSQWENSSCKVVFSRANSNITCNCLHMSYYSIIDDYLIRPQKVPLVYLTFRNWSSFIVFLYIILVFVIGTIYTFNKDNQDFRYLHEQEELQGGTSLSSENSVNLVSLTFKRKVFFMMFAEQYKFKNLMKLYIMLLHPLFQLKYRLDPEHPRFYRFLLLFTRIMILFALCFYILKDVENFDKMSGSSDLGIAALEVVILGVLGSILLVPMPIVLLCCCRSRYFLIDPKGRSRDNSENDMEDDVKGSAIEQQQRNRISDVMIDTNIPIKLLFLINAFKIDDILEHYKDTLSYATGDSRQIGKKLFELDFELQREIEEAKAKKVHDSTDDNNSKKGGKNQGRRQSSHNKEEANTIHTQAQLKDVEASKRGGISRITEDSKSVKNRDSNYRIDSENSFENVGEIESNDKRLKHRSSGDNEKNNKSLRDAESNRPLAFSPNKSKMHRGKDEQQQQNHKRQFSQINGPNEDLDQNRTDMDMLSPPNGVSPQDIDYSQVKQQRGKGRQSDASSGKKSKKKFEDNYLDDEENLDDDDPGILQSQRKRQQIFEGGEKEKGSSSRNSRGSGKNTSKSNANGPEMDFEKAANSARKNDSPNRNRNSQANNRASGNASRSNRNTNRNSAYSANTPNTNNNQNNEEGEENESDLESIDTQLFVDEKKELIEDRDKLLLAFGNTTALIINLGLFIAVLASFVAGGYYDKTNQYVWVVVFFGAQLFSIFVTDILVLYIVAFFVSKGCRKNKTFLTRWMRESLYIYEDYKYVVTFANTRIT